MTLVLRALLGLMLIVIVVLAVSYLRAAQRARSAEAAFPPEGQIVQVGAQTVHVVVEGSGPDLVLIHGASGNARDMTFQLSKMLATSYRVFAVDRPGFGYSSLLPGVDGGSLQAQAEVLDQAVTQLGARQPIVLGHSYGGGVALAWAVYRPQSLSGLVLVSSVAHPWSTGIAALYKWTGTQFGRWVIDPILAAFVPDSRIEQAVTSVYAPQTPPRGYLEHIGGALSLRRDSLWVNAAQRRFLLPQIEAQAPLYPQITVPVEALHGTADTTVSAAVHMEPLQQQLPDMGLTLIDGMGHALQNAAPRAVVDAVGRVHQRATP